MRRKTNAGQLSNLLFAICYLLFSEPQASCRELPKFDR